MKKAIVMLGLAAALASCSSAPPVMDAPPETFKPNPGGATIYVLRGVDPVFLAGASVNLDGRPVASLRRYDYVRLDVSPGTRRITCGLTDTYRDVEVQPGRTAFIEALLRVGWMVPSCDLLTLDDVKGRERVMAGTRVVPGI